MPATTSSSAPAASTSRRSAPSSSSTTSTSSGTTTSSRSTWRSTPDLHDTFWKAAKQASKVKQSIDAAAAKELLAMIDTIDEMWKATGGPGEDARQRTPLLGRCRAERGPERAAFPGARALAAIGVAVGRADGSTWSRCAARSMAPSLLPGDRLLVESHSYRAARRARGGRAGRRSARAGARARQARGSVDDASASRRAARGRARREHRLARIRRGSAVGDPLAGRLPLLAARRAGRLVAGGVGGLGRRKAATRRTQPSRSAGSSSTRSPASAAISHSAPASAEPPCARSAPARAGRRPPDRARRRRTPRGSPRCRPRTTSGRRRTTAWCSRAASL